MEKCSIALAISSASKAQMGATSGLKTHEEALEWAKNYMSGNTQIAHMVGVFDLTSVVTFERPPVKVEDPTEPEPKLQGLA